MIIVPDASVILKWVLEKETEPGYRQGLMLQEAFLAEEIDICVPTLWRYEVGNVLGLKKPKMATELMEALFAYEFDEVPLRNDYALAVPQHMNEVAGVTFYDATYYVLALRTKGVYLTADVAYIKQAKGKGHVSLLSEWHGP